MKKTKTFFLTLLIILLLLSGCNKNIFVDGDSGNNHNDLLEKQGYNIFDFTFYLDNIEYSLPQPLENFFANGWQIQGVSVEISMEKDETKYIELKKNNTNISASILNEKNHNIDITKSTVVSVTYDGKSNDQDKDMFKLFDEVFIGQNFSNVSEIIGKPSKLKYMNEVYIAEYYLSRLSSTEFYFSTTSDILEKIIVTNNQELFTYSKENVKIKKYSDSTALNNTPLSNSIEFYGEVFALPIKVSDLIYYDWTAKSNVLKNINPKETVNVTLVKENISINIMATNNDDLEKQVLDCEVTSFEYNEVLNYGENPFTLPKEITKTSTQTDIIEKYGTPLEQDEGYVKYVSDNNDIEIIFIFSKEGNMQIMSFKKITP